mgnify:CR=1 FL=1
MCSPGGKGEDDVLDALAVEGVRHVHVAASGFDHGGVRVAAAARLGLAPETLRTRHPRLIVCGLSGYGATGPYCDKKAYDLLVQAESGVISITGTAQDQVKVAVSVADIAAGMYALSSILAALLRRAASGEGSA